MSSETGARGAAPDLTRWGRAHLVGIGGAGMSGIARLLLARGIGISGSDLKESKGLQALREAGAAVRVGHRAENVDHPDVVVVSSAIPQENPEVNRARERGIPILARAEVLAALMAERRSVAVAGTHGKTTTTSMVAVLLTRLGRSPTFVIGGDLNESGSGAQHGTGDVFVAEADESDGSFLMLRPDIAVITNVEEDHLDYYADREHVEAAFARFAGGAGRVVACWDDPGVRRVLTEFAGDVLSYGTEPGADILIRDIVLDRSGSRSLIEVGERAAGVPVELRLSVPGRHNVLNAAAAFGVGIVLGIPVGAAAQGLTAFRGVRRRFERRGRVAGAEFIDDYAHHPTELSATLAAARVERPRRLIAVFQPHRYTRTEAMWRALGQSLGAADLVVVTDIYPAGEPPIPGITGKLLAGALAECQPGKRIVYLPRRSDVAPFLAGEVREGDLVLTLGAGDITMTGEEAMQRIREVADD